MVIFKRENLKVKVKCDGISVIYETGLPKHGTH
jgi:hypothetical protein